MVKQYSIISIFLGLSYGLYSQSEPQNKGQNYVFNNSSGSLSSRWELDSNQELFRIVAYKPVYILFGNYTTDINNRPTSDNPNNVAPKDVDLENTELKFQLSFKTKGLQNIFGKKVGGDLWIAYTQTSRWQLYSGKISRPFRETNYEPEVMFVLPTRYKLFGLEGVYAGIGVNHQSNGRSNPLSRSWNRVIAQFGWQAKNTSIILRPWWRIQEPLETDDNPGIENYIGRMELVYAYEKDRHDISVQARHSLRGGKNNRGSLQIDYGYRVYDYLKIHLQIFHGYGESMIDYNHYQTTFGLGVSLIEWR